MSTSVARPSLNRRSFLTYGSLLATSGAIGGALTATGAAPSQAVPAVRWKELSTRGVAGGLNGVAGKGSTIWAVGSAGDGDDSTPIAMQFRNGGWQATAQPAPDLASLASVAIVSANEVWAVGEQVIPDSADSRPVVVRWNGSRWQQVSFPAKIGGLGQVVHAAGSIWVGGWASVSGTEHAVVYRYTNGTWKRLDKGIEAIENVNCLHVFADGTAWAGLNPGMAHFDGTSWSLSPEWPTDGSMISSKIIARSAEDLYAAGVGYGGNGTAAPLISRYDGAAWRRQSTPEVDGQLYDLALSKDRVMAVGERFADDGSVTQLVLREDSSGFSVHAGPTDRDGGLLALIPYDTELLTTGYVDSPDMLTYSAVSQSRWTM